MSEYQYYEWQTADRLLAEHRKTRGDFRRRVADLCARYSRLPGLQSRVQEAGLTK